MRLSAKIQGYPVGSVVSLMSQSAKAVVVIDACRDNPFTRSVFRGGSPNEVMLTSSLSIQPKIERGGVYVVFSPLKSERATNGGDLSSFVRAFKIAISQHQ